MTEHSGATLWNFSFALYNRRAVQTVCIALQDRHDLDVNMLLYCCWLATRNIAIDGIKMQAILSQIQDWQRDVVKPLRVIRHRMKGGIGSFPIDEAEVLRARIKKLELESEYMEQQQLEAATRRLGERELEVNDYSSLALANLEFYFVASRFKLGSMDTKDLETLVTESMRLNASDN